MRTIAEYKVRLPDYSLNYLINGESDELDNNEVSTIENYMQFYHDLANKHNGHVNINIDSEESSFTWMPAFGLACSCYDATIIILA